MEQTTIKLAVPEWAEESVQWAHESGYIDKNGPDDIPAYRLAHFMRKYDRPKIRCRIYTVGNVTVDQNKVNTVQEWFASYGWDFFFEPTLKYKGPGEWTSGAKYDFMSPKEVMEYTEDNVLPILFIEDAVYGSRGHVGYMHDIGSRTFIMVKEYSTRARSNGWAKNDGFCGTLRHELSHFLGWNCGMHDYTHYFDGVVNNKYKKAPNLGNFIMTLPRGHFAGNNRWPVPQLDQPQGM